MKVIILAGGSGTRLWPLSRTHYPKQFLKLKGMENSIFQLTLQRALNLSRIEDIFFVTNKDYFYLISGQLEELGFPVIKENILVEPEAKNTLPAITYAVKTMCAQDNDDIVVFSSDHLIADADLLTKTILEAQSVTNEYLVTFGIHPSGPETGYGYIRPGHSLGCCMIAAEFKEKPDFETAEKYVKDGYYWNSGMFLFQKSLFLELLKETSPEVSAAFDQDNILLSFQQTPSISIDYGLIEKTSRVAVMPFTGDWSDLGSFTTLYAKYDTHQDEDGNVTFNNDIILDSRNNLVYSDSDKAVALIGIDDLIIIDQRDALLICNKSETQRVKDAVTILKEKNDVRVDNHITEYRPWGSFTVLEDSDFYKVKRLSVSPEKRLSYQMHYHRSEHWVVVEGTAEVTIDGETTLLHSGQSIYISAGKKHRLKNPGRMFLEIIEVQSGRYLEEDDIVRFEDDYKR